MGLSSPNLSQFSVELAFYQPPPVPALFSSVFNINKTFSRRPRRSAVVACIWLRLRHRGFHVQPPFWCPGLIGDFACQIFFRIVFAFKSVSKAATKSSFFFFSHSLLSRVNCSPSHFVIPGESCTHARTSCDTKDGCSARHLLHPCTKFVNYHLILS